MPRSRRTILKSAAGVLACSGLVPSVLAATELWEPRPTKIRVGACVVGLEQGRKAGLDGVEVQVGGPAEQLEISRPEVRQRVQGADEARPGYRSAR